MADYLAGWLDFIVWTSAFIAGSVCAVPAEEADPKTQRFGMVTLALVVLRVVVFAVGE
jgi:hypothetical protein